MPDFTAFPVFKFRISELVKALKRDRDQLTAAINENTSPPAPAAPPPAAPAAAALPAPIIAGLAITDLGKVLSYGATNTQTLGAAVTLGDTALAVAVSAAARRQAQSWPIYSQVDATNAIPALLG